MLLEEKNNKKNRPSKLYNWQNSIGADKSAYVAVFSERIGKLRRDKKKTVYIYIRPYTSAQKHDSAPESSAIEKDAVRSVLLPRVHIYIYTHTQTHTAFERKNLVVVDGSSFLMRVGADTSHSARRQKSVSIENLHVNASAAPAADVPLSHSPALVSPGVSHSSARDTNTLS